MDATSLSLGALGSGMSLSGAPSPLAAYFRPGSGTRVGLQAASEGALHVWTEVADGLALCCRYDADDPTSRYSWRETRAVPLRKVYPVADLTLTGSWGQLQSSGSGLLESYTGNRAISASSTAASASVTVDRAAPYDLFIIYTGRTSGGFARVDIDGAQTLVNEIGDPADLGFKAFSTYHSTNLTRRLVMRVASGLTGSHTITVTPGGSASPGGNTVQLEAVAITGGLDDSRIQPPFWEPEITYAAGQEVQHNGIFYAARSNGPSGTAPPTHGNGIASDGAMEWRADVRSTYHDFSTLDYASEREYAARIEVGGQTVEYGGQTHGGEALQSRSITLDGAPWTPATTGTGITAGAAIDMTETSQWGHPTAGALADCTLTRRILPGQIYQDVTITPLQTLPTPEWFYPAMLPFVRWDGETKSDVLIHLHDGNSVIDLDTYAGQSAPDVTLSSPKSLGLDVTAPVGGFAWGFACGFGTDPVNGLKSVTGFLRPNIGGQSSGTGSDWQVKGYVRADDITLASGQPVRMWSRQTISLAPD
ncbi:hypothetical protein IV417_10305 [Alphaproteobacteria bacterium KMM 3653]|uniref:Uncharacterized protein n=1 Tax=Harenicola maris TaxID=2841044 RepID=A0AAP2CRB4_9RHOB|nr:hypothetical protein [Harenicola maris]